MGRRHLALLHPHEVAVALVTEGAGLPCVEEPLGGRFEDPGAVPDYAGGGTGSLPAELAVSHLPVLTFLCCLGEIAGEDGVPTERLYLCEAFPGVQWQPERLAWWHDEGEGYAPPPGLLNLPGSLLAALRTALERLGREGGGGADGADGADGAPAAPRFDPLLWSRGEQAPQLPAFVQPGFTAVLAKALAASPLVRIGEGGSAEGEPLRQLRSWSLSSVWTSESYVLKLPHQVWSHEAAVTARLARLVPSHVAAVVASGTVTPQHPNTAPATWFLQERVTPTSDASEASPRLAAALALAELQRSCRGLEPELLALGLPDRGPESTAAALELVWLSPELAALDEDARRLLPKLDSLLRRKLEDLHRLGAPLLLCHGDLHLGNVIVAQRGAVIIDWTDASLAWPGVDLVNLLGFSEPHEETPVVLEAYLRALDGLLPAAVEPERLVRQGMELAHAFQAVSYATIEAFRPAEVRWEMEGVVRRLVSLMLRRWFQE